MSLGQWEVDPRDGVTFHRSGAVVTFDEERSQWHARLPSGHERWLPNLERALGWAEAFLEDDE